MKCQAQIVEVVLGLMQFGCGASLLRGMLDLLKTVYLHGDFTKVQAEFFD